MSYRVSELEELCMLLGKRHRSTEDATVAFEIMLEKCAESGMNCRNCPIYFEDNDVEGLADKLASNNIFAL